MRTATIFVLGLIGAVIALASDVSSLTNDTFTGFLTENDLVLVECEYRAPTCVICPER